ncbi:F0F1 ATP synthase subunit B [Candidatus Pantoea carbekii]|nr:F0F1 ATP synthase subunit B [Candidatus Pantoea carbekii]AKC32301.1 ATP synthase subunit F [Candidatus Pantoea carbekii]
MNINATIFGQAIAFVLFVAFCMKYIWPPIMAAIEKRQKEIAEEFASVERAKKDLQRANADAIEKVNKAINQALLITEQANQSRLQILHEAKIEAEAERMRIIAQAQSIITVELLRVREELHKKVSMLVLTGVNKIIERSMDETIDSDIIDKLISKL